MGIDLKKEIKLSDVLRLFRRKAKQADVTGEPKEKPPKERRSLRRRGKNSTEPAPRKERRFLGRRKRAAGRDESLERTALPIPSTPLMRAFNLMPTEEGRQAGGGRARLSYVLVALAGVLAVAGLAGGFFHASAQVAEKQARYDELRLELAELRTPTKEPDGTQDAAFLEERRKRTSALAGLLAQRVVWDRLLRELSLVVPREVFLDSVQAQSPAGATAPGAAPASPPGSPAPTTFNVVGCADDQDTVAELLARLSTIPEFSEVQLVSSTVVAVSECGKPVTFTIGAAIKSPGAA